MDVPTTKNTSFLVLALTDTLPHYVCDVCCAGSVFLRFLKFKDGCSHYQIRSFLILALTDSLSLYVLDVCATWQFAGSGLMFLGSQGELQGFSPPTPHFCEIGGLAIIPKRNCQIWLQFGYRSEMKVENFRNPARVWCHAGKAIFFPGNLAWKDFESLSVAPWEKPQNRFKFLLLLQISHP
jgi:hypothetical protein